MKNLVFKLQATIKGVSLGISLLFAVGASATQDLVVDAVGTEKVSHFNSMLTGFGGRDLIPWPWGSECPFPWSDISGTYKVQGQDGKFVGHTLSLEIADTKAIQHEFLSITQYDQEKRVYAYGTARTQKDSRIVKGVLEPVKGGAKYIVIVRAYDRDSSVDCGGDQARVVTFCPMRGKKCMQDSNFEIVPTDADLN